MKCIRGHGCSSEVCISCFAGIKAKRQLEKARNREKRYAERQDCRKRELEAKAKKEAEKLMGAARPKKITINHSKSRQEIERIKYEREIKQIMEDDL